MKRPHIGLAGCGQWGVLILRDLVALGADVSVVARSAESRRRATQGGARQVVDRPDSCGDVDGWVVSTPTSTHAEVIESVVDDGQPIMVEKPFTDSLKAGQRLVDQAGQRIFVMDKWRYHPGIEKMRQMVSEGKLGELVQIRCQRTQWGNRHGDVGPLWILLPHDFAILFHILGRLPEVEKVVALARQGSEDAVLTLLHDPGGPMAIVETSVLSPVHHRDVTVAGKLGALELADAYARELLWRRGDEAVKIPISDDMPLKLNLQAFLAYLAGGPPPMSSAAEGLSMVERIEQVLRLLAQTALPVSSPARA